MIVIKKVISILLVLVTLLTSIPYTALALSWDGDSAGGSTNAVNGSSTGYVIRSTSDSACVVGYRFSAVDSDGDMKVTKVIDVYRKTSNGNNAYSTSAKFSTKYNKLGIIKNKDKNLTTTENTTNCYKESNMGFVTELPNPSGVETWQSYETNINKVLSKLGVGSVSNMVYGDKVIIEPLFDVCLAGEYQALTVSEMAYCGRSVLGGSSKGGTSDGTSKTWGFISSYTNRIWPNKLYTPDGQGLWTGVSAIGSSAKETFNNIMTKGYGVGIAYTEKTNNTYTIKFNGNGHTSGSTASMTMTFGVAKNLTANGFSKTGHYFNGWNTKSNGIGGAYSVDKFYRLMNGWAWFSNEQPSDEIKAYVEKQLLKAEHKVDIILSHTCPKRYEPTEVFLKGLDQSLVDKSTEEWLDKIEQGTDYRKWYCGHFHTAKKIDKLQFMFEDIDVLSVR